MPPEGAMPPEAQQAEQPAQQPQQAQPPAGIASMQSPITQQGVQSGMTGMDLRLAAANLAQQLRNMTDADRNATLLQMQTKSPELRSIVLQYLHQPDQRMMQPLPDQLPPRRDAGVAVA